MKEEKKKSHGNEFCHGSDIGAVLKLSREEKRITSYTWKREKEQTKGCTIVRTNNLGYQNKNNIIILTGILPLLLSI